ncbi:endonuclease/exonuclease/phosphatase family protein [cf. Phormidesmis sp. LEGE 11477]|uniref:endonuclease/exonuclease/phosphatase family protein n=1 Tax=cf. Phormidesmis sp. LEGE 11477 TaxID=1828680 RepID=UPI00187E3B92|nr:endonuclease/exonuclease/phosphatase family protein [cf. Phormidesmis sp. LEGE 11477]MBE9060399.1 endonuclease/exonuclease/phosphatase family protein [cf. Phormidesmis sp. LEGE 11477]
MLQSLANLFGLDPAESQVVEGGTFSKAELPNQDLCILNWNIAKQNHKLPLQQEFLKIFHQQRPQLCFFQEARLAWPEAYSLMSLPKESLEGSTEESKLTTGLGWYFTPNLIHRYQGYAAGVLTASTAPALNSATLHSQYYEPFLQTRKLVLVTEYPIAQRQQTLWAINVHGINFVRSHKFQKQIHQIEQAIADHSGPLILVGDFNTWRPKRMQILQTVIRRLGLQAVDFSLSYRSDLKRFMRSDPLDHIFYRGLTLQPHHAKVFGEMISSDHKPMVAKFDIIAS